MLYKTRGLVLNFIEYRETSIIVRVFTEEFGLQSYIENGVRSAKSKGKIALFQPLTLLDMVVYYKPERSISRISEARCPKPFYHIPTDIKKTTIAMFLSEILSLTLKEHTENKPLFSFISKSLDSLEEMEEFVENYHLYFMINLSHFLGFGPASNQDISAQLRQEGIFLDKAEEDILHQLILQQPVHNLLTSRSQRSKILDILIDFYRLNIDTIKTVKSVAILKEILD